MYCSASHRDSTAVWSRIERAVFAMSPAELRQSITIVIDETFK
jgi:hypothetical protein